MSLLNKVIVPRTVARKKLAPLATLPVFFNLRQASVIVVGNSAELALKLELLLATGAHVNLFADAPCPELLEIIGESGEALRHHSKVWSEYDVQNARLAVCDFDTRAEIEAFVKLARASRVSVAALTHCDLSDFHFGAIVNRSPVIVSVSTPHVAPVLAEAICARIETLLPSSLADWSKRAKTLPSDLIAAFPDLASRKSVWNEFARRALSEPKEKIDVFFREALRPRSQSKRGKVTLVGAGPGRADLLTLKAIRALQTADIILFDKLVSDEVLELARREAKRMLVGKRGGQASCHQDDINALMVKLAKQGKNVVRLKSGDPMIFGRAGEEIAILEDEGIQVESIPGVTAALAVASRLGISLTHRDCAQSVKFITAHSRDGELPKLDWQSCADPTTTLMIYMGAKTAPKLAESLLARHVDPQMPVMIAKGISQDREEISYRRLTDLLTLNINRDMPVLIGIGHVFAERCSQSEQNNFQNAEMGVLGVLTG